MTQTSKLTRREVLRKKCNGNKEKWKCIERKRRRLAWKEKEKEHNNRGSSTKIKFNNISMHERWQERGIIKNSTCSSKYADSFSSEGIFSKICLTGSNSWKNKYSQQFLLISWFVGKTQIDTTKPINHIIVAMHI